MQEDSCPDDAVSMSVLWSVVNRQLIQVKQGMRHVHCISFVNEQLFRVHAQMIW